jgi:hypothetical protein
MRINHLNKVNKKKAALPEEAYGYISNSTRIRVNYKFLIQDDIRLDLRNYELILKAPQVFTVKNNK